MAKFFDNRWLIGKVNLLLGGLLTLLGFSSCGSKAFNEECLYGQPYAKYSIKGAVLNDEARPLEGMKVTLKEVVQKDSLEFFDIHPDVATSSQGKYELKGSVDIYDATMRVIVDDPSGVYATDSTDVKPTLSKDGAGDWCIGTYEGEANFSLRKKD